jgi:hypothetical protein
VCIILWDSLGCSLRSLRFGPGECFGYSSRSCASCLRRASRICHLPSELLLLRMALCAWRIRRWVGWSLGCSAYYPYYSPRALPVLRPFGSARRSVPNSSFLSPAVGDVLRTRPLQAPAHGDRGRSFEHSLVSGYDLHQPLPALPDHSSLTRIRERYGLLFYPILGAD